MVSGSRHGQIQQEYSTGIRSGIYAGSDTGRIRRSRIHVDGIVGNREITECTGTGIIISQVGDNKVYAAACTNIKPGAGNRERHVVVKFNKIPLEIIITAAGEL